MSQERRHLPDAELLTDYGFEMVGHYEFTVEHHWTVPELAGLIRSTSFLPASVLGARDVDFDEDLAATLGPYTVTGKLTETVRFAYELAHTRM